MAKIAWGSRSRPGGCHCFATDICHSMINGVDRPTFREVLVADATIHTLLECYWANR